MENDNVIDALIPILEEWVYKVSEVYGNAIPNASGRLWDSIETFTSKRSTGVSAGLVLLSYWINIEEGRRPGARFPPVDAIKEWIRVKSIMPKPYRLPSGRDVIPTVDQMAYLIGRKISIEGIPARPELAKAVESLKDELIQSIQDKMSDEVFNQLKIMFE